MSMGIVTFIGLLIIGSIFSAGIIMFFKKKIVPGIVMMVLSILTYIIYISIVNTYFV